MKYKINFFKVLMISLSAMMLLSSCTGFKTSDTTAIHLADLDIFPQNASAFAFEGDKVLVSPAESAELAEDYKKSFFDPWHRSSPLIDSKDAFWALEAFAGHDIFGENTLKRNAEWLDKLKKLSSVSAYPALHLPAVTVRNTSLKALPTNKPIFYDFKKGGEGFPFDYNQNSAVWVGTPLLVTHISADGLWLHVECRFAFGWVKVQDIAFVDSSFIKKYESLKLAAIVKDNIPLRGNNGFSFAAGRIGMLLPRSDDNHLLIPQRDIAGMSELKEVRIQSDQIADWPLPFTENNMAGLINQIMGQQYGWGGLYQDRDCSATTMDIFSVFGVGIPRNSSQQATIGKIVDLSSLTIEEKTGVIAAQAIPFRTLLEKKGHIVLYLGEFNGHPAVLQTMWGIKTIDPDNGSEGRFIVGKTCITGLESGRDIPHADLPATLLIKGLRTMSFPLVDRDDS
jgi:hypothetical protein